MTVLLTVLCIILSIIIIMLAVKIMLLHKAAEQLREGFAQKLQTDTNTGIEISSEDRTMKRLAADLDRQLKVLRQARLRYLNGDQELKSAVTNISHDLRTPLTAICGYMDLLAQEELPETIRDYLSIIDNRVQAMKGLTEELFSYSVIMAETTGRKREEVTLNSAVEECIAAYYAAFQEADIAPEIALPEEPVIRRLNPQALSRILSNIVSNAIKYSDGDFYAQLTPAGRLHFKNRAAALDSVSTGHLFERFYTVESAKDSTGLGLSIARILTEEQGGQIDAVYEDGSLNIFLSFM